MSPLPEDLSVIVGAYANTAPCNERVHREFTEAAAADPILSAPCGCVEQHALGFGDAGFDLPGATFWKGYETVARACALLPPLGFANMLNVRYNRVFERTR